MKRSQMVDSMMKFWWGIFAEQDLDPAMYDECHENMDKLLSYIEYKGMQPPSAARSPDGTYDSKNSQRPFFIWTKIFIIGKKNETFRNGS